MLKKVLFFALATGFIAATALPMQIAPATAAGMAGMSCKEAAKMKYPDDRKERHAFKKECKAAFKASQSAAG
jgi:hypothetical protein